jgi:hypothetical protein
MLPSPSELVPFLTKMAAPDFEQTNVLFDFPSRGYRTWS